MVMKVNFTAKGPNLRGKLAACVRFEGSKNRNYKLVKGIRTRDLSTWDQERQMFMAPTEDAMNDSIVVSKMRDDLMKIFEQHHPATAAELFRLYDEGVADRKPLTLGGFISVVVEEMRSGRGNKKPSRHYQNYITLLHKLEDEGYIVNLPMSEIDNSHFVRFSDYLIRLHEQNGAGTNYYNLMKLFKQVHTKAYQRNLNDNTLRFRYSDYGPAENLDCEKMPVFTKEDYARFLALDLGELRHHGVNPEFYKNLYKDYCIFLYETLSRPADVMKMKLSDIMEVKGKMYLRYVPEKKKNSRARNKVVYTPLNERAMSVVDKYRGRSASGYIFPFSMNDCQWDMNNAESWNRWRNRNTRAQNMINAWLKKVAFALGIEFPLTLYTFRRSALTHACADDPNYMQIALRAGTSPDMLVRHYVDNTAFQ